MMRTSDLEKFSNLFLFLDGDQAVVKSWGQEHKERAKRPHTKSRNGCLACKRRRVKVRHAWQMKSTVNLQLTWSSTKCDERVPCGHCVNRKEKCERPGPRPQVKIEVPQQPSSPSQHVNILHIELFNHFEKVTQFTLAFPEIWGIMLQESFKVRLRHVGGNVICRADQGTSTSISCTQSWRQQPSICRSCGPRIPGMPRQRLSC